MQQLSIARAGGGTGGHVFPIKSLIRFLQDSKDGKQIKNHYRFGSKNSLEQESCLELQESIAKLHFIPILSGKLRRERSFIARIKNIQDFFKCSIGLCQSVFLLWKYKIDIVFCKGGYVALPVVLAAKILGKKIVVHESDVRPGLVNRIAGHFANANFTGFPDVLPNSQVVGQILSDDIIPEHKPQKSSPKTEVLVMGGSQGSEYLYKSIAHILHKEPELQKLNFTIILGKLNQELAQLFATFGNIETLDFVSQKEIGLLYEKSDIAITRAGTTSLAEQELFDLKLIMVPIPRTHDQLENAKRYVKHKNAILIEQDQPDFLKHLPKTLQGLIGFKKEPSQRDKKTEIQKAKKLITETIMNI